MGELQIFKNEEFGEIRTVELEGKPYFCGKDVAGALGYAIPKDAIAAHCKGGGKTPHPYKRRNSGAFVYSRGRFIPSYCK